MPTYAYACSACEHAFDIRQSFSDDALTVCPQCEQESLRKVFSPVGVVFKGSGFYRTDSRANATGKAKTKGTGSAGPPNPGPPNPGPPNPGPQGSGSAAPPSSGGSAGASAGSGSSTTSPAPAAKPAAGGS